MTKSSLKSLCQQQVNCNKENVSMLWNGTKDTYLGCETTVGGGNASVTCVLSRNRGEVGQCVNKAECHYKKGASSCFHFVTLCFPDGLL